MINKLKNKFTEFIPFLYIFRLGKFLKSMLFKCFIVRINILFPPLKWNLQLCEYS